MPLGKVIDKNHEYLQGKDLQAGVSEMQLIKPQGQRLEG